MKRASSALKFQTEALPAGQRAGASLMLQPTADSHYSVVMPVFNGGAVVSETIDRIVSYFQSRCLAFELIAVNDGSSDDTWEVLKREVAQRPNLVVVNLVKNFGQHPATQCGLRLSTGDYVITMDDDLQHDPSDIDSLIGKASLGHDVVFARFGRARRKWYRHPESVMATVYNRIAFGMRANLAISSFRLLRRDVVNRMVALETTRSYVTGLAMASATNPGNADASTHQGIRKHSTYSLARLVRLAAAVLFSGAVAPQSSGSYQINEIVRSARK